MVKTTNHIKSQDIKIYIIYNMRIIENPNLWDYRTHPYPKKTMFSSSASGDLSLRFVAEARGSGWASAGCTDWCHWISLEKMVTGYVLDP
jgi:hypothetical protein